MDNNDHEPASVTFQRLRDAQVAPVTVNRLERILNEVYLGNVAVFCTLSKGALMEAYNKVCPDSARGLGKNTFDGFNLFVKYQKASTYDAKMAAVEAEKLREQHEADKEAAKAEALSKSVDLKVMADVVAWYATAFETVTIDELMSSYEKFKAKAAN